MFSAADLAALVAVADTGSVSAAAAVLGRTQPAVTQAIRRLEDAVGFLLLDRSFYRAHLTDKGESFVKRARLSVNHARNLRDFAVALSRGVEPQVRLSVDGAIPAPVWLDLIEEAARRFPDTPFEIKSGQDHAPLQRLEDGEADLAVLFDVTVRRRRADIMSRPLGRVEFRNVVRADRRNRLLETEAMIPQIYVADFNDAGPGYGSVEGQRHWRVSTHRMQADAILAGLGWGSIPETLIAEELEGGLLVSLPYLGLRERSSYPFSLYRQRDRELGPVCSLIWQGAGEAM